MREAGLSHQANGHNSANGAHIYSWIFQLLRGFLRVRRQDLRDGMRESVFRRRDSLPESLNAFQLLAQQSVNLFVQYPDAPSYSGCASVYNYAASLGKRSEARGIRMGMAG